jgi:hypothetical protein
MGRRISGAVCFLMLAMIAPGTIYGQESCDSPTVIPAGSTGSTEIDLVTLTDDHDGCGVPRPGPDVVFLADGHNVKLTFVIANEAVTTETFYLDFTFWCHPDSACNASFGITLPPGQSFTLGPTISQPIYVVVNGPDTMPSTLPVRFNYSLEAETQVATTTWGRLKNLYR